MGIHGYPPLFFGPSHSIIHPHKHMCNHVMDTCLGDLLHVLLQVWVWTCKTLRAKHCFRIQSNTPQENWMLLFLSNLPFWSLCGKKHVQVLSCDNLHWFQLGCWPGTRNRFFRYHMGGQGKAWPKKSSEWKKNWNTWKAAKKKKNKGWNQGTSFLILDLPKNGITERHDENVGCHKRVWVAMQHGRLGKIDCHENIL